MLGRRHLLAATTGLLAAPAVASAQGAAWPTRAPVRLIAQFPPGGLVDTITRLVAPPLSQVLGQNVVVENRAGAGGVIGTDYVAKQPADGYTFLMTHASVMVYSAATLPSLPFDPINDFTHLAQLVEAASVLLVRGDSPLRTFQDYLAAARTRPIRYGSSGIGSAPHMLGAMLGGQANLSQLDHAPYAGSAPAMRDLLGGHIESLIDPITTNVEAMRNGTLRALAISTPQRLAAFPNVPTFAELGFPSLVQTQWVGISGPRGLPAPIAERMIREMPGIMQNAALVTRTTELQTMPRNPIPTGNDFINIIRTELTAAREVARRYNIQATS
jgi:tripartite-type tricarboxylate transporter receptor subunit TctC